MSVTTAQPKAARRARTPGLAATIGFAAMRRLSPPGSSSA